MSSDLTGSIHISPISGDLGLLDLTPEQIPMESQLDGRLSVTCCTRSDQRKQVNLTYQSRVQACRFPTDNFWHVPLGIVPDLSKLAVLKVLVHLEAVDISKIRIHRRVWRRAQRSAPPTLRLLSNVFHNLKEVVQASICLHLSFFLPILSFESWVK